MQGSTGGDGSTNTLDHSEATDQQTFITTRGDGSTDMSMRTRTTQLFKARDACYVCIYVLHFLSMYFLCTYVAYQRHSTFHFYVLCTTVFLCILLDVYYFYVLCTSCVHMWPTSAKESISTFIFYIYILHFYYSYVHMWPTSAKESSSSQVSLTAGTCVVNIRVCLCVPMCVHVLCTCLFTMRVCSSVCATGCMRHLCMRAVLMHA